MEPSRRQGPGVIAVVIVSQTGANEPEPPDEPGGIIDRELEEIFDHYWREHGGEG